MFDLTGLHGELGKAMKQLKKSIPANEQADFNKFQHDLSQAVAAGDTSKIESVKTAYLKKLNDASKDCK